LKTAATTDKNYKKATIIILPQQERSFSFYSSLSNIFFNKKKFKKTSRNFNNQPIPT